MPTSVIAMNNVNKSSKSLTKGRPDAVTFESKGFRDVIWCPYANEPAFLEYHHETPWCPECNGNYEPETHEFIVHILKPK